METPDPKELGLLALIVGALTAFFRFAVPAMRKKNGNGHQAAMESAYTVAQLTHLQRIVSLQEQMVEDLRALVASQDEAVRALGSLRRILVEQAVQLRGVEAGVETMMQHPDLMRRARDRYRLDYREEGA